MTTATATAERIAVQVPAEMDFMGADFLADTALTELFAEVVEQYPRLQHIIDHDISVSVLWKRKGGKKQGAPTFAKCVKPSGLAGHFCPAAFAIWLGADTIAEQEWTTEQIAKLLYHEARHIGWQDPDEDDEDGEGKAIILGHDVELFVGEVEDTGAWEHFRRELGKDFQQAGLFG